MNLKNLINQTLVLYMLIELRCISSTCISFDFITLNTSTYTNLVLRL